MRIGDLARQAGVDVQTVRYYEREGVLDEPVRSAAGYRIYDLQHLQRLNFVRHCCSLDMSLAEIKRLIELSRGDVSVSCDEVDLLVRGHLEKVRAKRAAHEALEARLSALSTQCASGQRVADCRILAELIHASQGDR